MKVLVTGSNGYLGSVLCKELSEHGHQVHGIDSFMFNNDINEYARVLMGDIRNGYDLSNAIDDVDAVVHLASLVGDAACNYNPMATFEINFLASNMLASMCNHNYPKRLIFASTSNVYAGVKTHNITEITKPIPLSLYGKMKLEAERQMLSVTRDIDCTILRMPSLYGASPRMRFDLVINLLTMLAKNNGKFTVFGGEQYRPFLHVKDMARLYRMVLEAPLDSVSGEIFNAGANRCNYKVREVGELIQDLVPNSKMKIDKTASDERDYHVSFNKIEKSIGFENEYDIEDGIKEILNNIDNGMYDNYPNPVYSNYETIKTNGIDINV